jgi:two-component system cell cycle response regulator DivK
MRRLLIIDDDSEIRELLVDFLGMLGYEVITAKNGQEGLDAYLSGEFDAAFIDIRMPVMDGLQCARQIKADNPDFTIIIMTGLLKEYSREQIFAAGINELIEKPFNLDNIEQILSKYLN